MNESVILKGNKNLKRARKTKDEETDRNKFKHLDAVLFGSTANDRRTVSRIGKMVSKTSL